MKAFCVIAYRSTCLHVCARILNAWIESFDKNECLRIRKSRMRLDKWAFYWSADLFNQDLVEETVSHQSTPIAHFILFYYFDYWLGCCFEWVFFSPLFKHLKFDTYVRHGMEEKINTTKCDAFAKSVFFFYFVRSIRHTKRSFEHHFHPFNFLVGTWCHQRSWFIWYFSEIEFQ